MIEQFQLSRRYSRDVYIYIYIHALPGYLSIHREWKVYEPEEYTTSVSKFARFLFNFHEYACIEHVSSAHLPLGFESENFCGLSDWIGKWIYPFPSPYRVSTLYILGSDILLFKEGIHFVNIFRGERVTRFNIPNDIGSV